MPKPKKPPAGRTKPRLDQIVEPVITPGVDEFIKLGKTLSAGAPGTLVLLAGKGFGTDASAASVLFGETAVSAFPVPLFTDSFIVTTVPLISPGAAPVSVNIAGQTSNELPFRVQRSPSPPQPPGTTTLKFLSRLDAFAVLVAAEIRIADFGRFATREFQNELVLEVMNARVGLLQARQRFITADDMGADVISIIEVAEEAGKQLLMRVGKRVADRSKAVFDQVVDGSHIIRQLELGMARVRQGGTTTATKTLEIVAEGANLAADVAGAAESATQSFSVSASIGVADVSGNTTVAVAAIVFGLLKAVANAARIAALLSRNADEARQELEEEDFRRRTESKLDRSESKLDKVESKMERIESKQDRTESKLDRTEQKLDKNEMKKDKIEVKLDRVEQKLDRNEIKKDRIEAKLDRVEPKLDRVETKLDRQEGKLDKLEGKADRAEGKLDRLEGKADIGERKMDRLESKSDKAEGKLDKVEGKLDKLEGKADKAETKLDKLEGKSDKAEAKLDRLEEKADKTEIKIDFLQIKADRTKEFWQFSPDDWTVSNARIVGVRVQGSLLLPGPTGAAFSVESIHLLADGFKVIRLIVDSIATDVAAQNVTTPCNLLVALGLALVGASDSVAIEFDEPYTGRVEFNGEKPQALKLCTFVEGEGSSQTSPNPCES